MKKFSFAVGSAMVVAYLGLASLSQTGCGSNSTNPTSPGNAPTNTPTISPTGSSTPFTSTPSGSTTPSGSVTPTPSPTTTALLLTPLFSFTPTLTGSPLATSTPSPTSTGTPSFTPTATFTATPTVEIPISLDISGGGATVTGDTTTGQDNYWVDDLQGDSLGQGAPDVAYRITVTTPESLFLNLCGASFDSVLYLRSGSPTGSTVSLDDDSDFCGGTSSSLVTGTLQPGTYYVIVDGYGNGDYGPYTLAVSVFNPPCTLATVSAPVTNTQSNNSADLVNYTNAISLGPVSGSGDAVGAGDANYYFNYYQTWTFQVQANGTYQVSLDCFDDGTSKFRARFYLLQDNGGSRTSLGVSPAGDPVDSLTFSLQSGVTYDVAVAAYDSNAPSGDYHLVLQGVSATATPTLTGTATWTLTPVATDTPGGATDTPTASVTRTITSTPTFTPSDTHTPKPTKTFTPTVTDTPTPYWQAVGNPGFTADQVAYTSLSIDHSGDLYLAYSDLGNNGRFTARAYNGTGWPLMGPTASNKQASFISSAIPPNGTFPFVVFEGALSGTADFGLMLDFGGSYWGEEGGSYCSRGDVYYTSTDFGPYTDPLVAYSDVYAGQRATVVNYSSSYSQWQFVGPEGFTADQVAYTSLKIDDNNGKVYLAYSDLGNGGQASVRYYDATSNSWPALGSLLFSAGEADYLSMAITPTGAPVVAYVDKGNGGKATVKKYTGSSWVNLGGAGFTADQVSSTSLFIGSSGKIFLAYSDLGHSGKATVRSYDSGTDSWPLVGSADFSAGTAYFISLQAYNDTPYVAYSDNGNGGQATVMVYQ